MRSSTRRLRLIVPRMRVAPSVRLVESINKAGVLRHLAACAVPERVDDDLRRSLHIVSALISVQYRSIPMLRCISVQL